MLQSERTGETYGVVRGRGDAREPTKSSSRRVLLKGVGMTTITMPLLGRLSFGGGEVGTGATDAGGAGIAVWLRTRNVGRLLLLL